MKKMPSLFIRNFDLDCPATPEITPGCEWVINGEGCAYRKWDGTAVMVRDEKIFARYDNKRGKTPPEGFEPCQDPDPITGHWPGWVPATRKEDIYIQMAAAYSAERHTLADGTYEAVGPMINGNNDGLPYPRLIKHDSAMIAGPATNFEAIRQWLSENEVEGLVWHHPDGRMCKIKRSDFGFKWGAR